MISNNEIKYVKSLHQKKCRDVENCFVVEGVKVVEELMRSDFEVQKIYGLGTVLDFLKIKGEEVTSKELERFSNQQNPEGVLAIVTQKQYELQFTKLPSQLSLVLCNANDPGNLGTIIRLADWFGIDQIICGLNSVDLYNPKVVQASMGSIFRVAVVYANIVNLLAEMAEKIPIYGALMEGESLYTLKKTSNGLVVFGSESHGISGEIAEKIKNKFTIPKIGKAESLNLATAVAIVCSEFSRP